MAGELLDPTIEAEVHVGTRLERSPIVWLTTVSAAAAPHTVPVWFAWDDPAIVVFSQPGTLKLAHLRTNPAVSLALDSASHGADIVLGEGRAELTTFEAVRDVLPAFEAKYRPMVGGQSLDEWFQTFSQPIAVQVERLIAWTRTEHGLDYRSLPRRQHPSPS